MSDLAASILDSAEFRALADCAGIPAEKFAAFVDSPGDFRNILTPAELMRINEAGVRFAAVTERVGAAMDVLTGIVRALTKPETDDRGVN